MSQAAQPVAVGALTAQLREAAINAGDGNDIVHASSTNGSDTVAFDSGVAHDQLWFAQSNNNLVVSVIGEDQSITMAGWFTSTNNWFRRCPPSSAPPLRQTTLPTSSRQPRARLGHQLAAQLAAQA